MMFADRQMVDRRWIDPSGSRECRSASALTTTTTLSTTTTGTHYLVSAADAP